MKKMTRSLILMAALCGVAPFSILPGFAQATPFYITGGVGPAFTEDTGLREFNGPKTGTKVKFDPGVQFRVAVGYRITDWLAAELESGVTYNTIKSITGASEANGTLANSPFLA